MNKQEPQNIYQHLIVLILSLAAPLVLYLFRHLDDNRLTSWNWVINSISFSRFLVVLIIAFLFAWLFSRVSFYEKRKPFVLFVTSFVMASFFWSEPEVIVDAARYFTQAKHLKVYGVGYFAEQWGKEIFAWTDLPLVPFLYGLVFKFFGEHRVLIQALNTIFYSLTVVLTYQLGKTLWDEEVGFLAGILLLGFPYLYTQVPLLLVDVPTMFFFMLAVVTCVYALKKGGINRIVVAGFSLFLIFYVKYSSWIMLTVIPVICVYFIFKKPVQTIKRSGALAFLSLILIGILFVMYKEIFMEQLNFLMEYQKPGLKRWSESYVSTFLFQVHPFITVAALFSLIVAVRKIDFKFIIVSFLLLVFLVMQVKRIRYTLPIFPMFALMAAYGIGAIQSKALKKHIVFSIVGTSFAVAYVGYLPLLKSLGVQNLQEAGKYLNTLHIANAEVVSFAGENAVVNADLGVPVLDIYTDKKLFYNKTQIEPQSIERVQTSPLRFTWEYPLPQYYSPGKEDKMFDGLVIISDDLSRPMPDAVENKISQYPVRKIFQQSSYIFKHQTFITVYHK
jgi:4-amino-4-deoxy-L-arabinose transferase-like glycosyltransferase